MSRYGKAQELDTPDTGYTEVELAGGLSENRPRSGQSGGQYRRLINGEVRRGYPETRRGTRPLGWMLNNGAPLGTNWQAVQWYRPITPDATARANDFVLAVVDNKLWLCRENNQPRLVNDLFTSYGQKCEIIPANQVVYILRGLEQAPVIYDPFGDTFGSIGVHVLPNPGSGTVLPAASTGCFAANRIVQKLNTDQLIFSDIFDWEYVAGNVFTAESRSGSEIVRIWPYANDSLLVFKQDTVVQFTGISDLDTMVARRVYGAYGCVAPRSVAQSGDLLFYLSPRGIEVLQLTVDNSIVQAGPEISRPVNRHMESINWDVAGNAEGVVVDGYYLLNVESRATWAQVDTLGREYSASVTVASDKGGVWTSRGVGFKFPISFPIVFTS